MGRFDPAGYLGSAMVHFRRKIGQVEGDARQGARPRSRPDRRDVAG
jgi:hypothetical protein